MTKLFMYPTALTLVTCAAFACGAATAADARFGWRGDGTGSFPDANPPVKWSATDNVLWKTPMPAVSNASPILVGDRIFVCSETSTLLCISAKDGAILWSRNTPLADALPENERRQALAEEGKAEETARKLRDVHEAQGAARAAIVKQPGDAALKAKLNKFEDEINDVVGSMKSLKPSVLPKTCELTGYATPTPTSDGKHVYAAFGTGIVACYDMEGHRRWVRKLDTNPSTYSEPRLYGVPESPLLAGGQLLVHFLKLTALDPRTGKTNWQADAEIHFGSPVRMRVGDIDAVVTACGDVFRISDGKALASKIWSSEGLPLSTCCSPIVMGDVACLAADAGGAVRLKPAKDGGIAVERLWDGRALKGWYVATPVHADGLLYALQKGGKLIVLDAASGKTVYKESLGIKGDNYPSMVLAGPYLYASNNEGETVVIKPGREYQEVARNTLEPFTSTPVFSGKRMYVRGQANLYCIGNK
jgi:outer membrane protein assembly factor BamB